MTTASLLLSAALLVFVTCLAWFVWDQRRVDNPIVNLPPVPQVFNTTINNPPPPLNPVFLSLFVRFDNRLTHLELETAARLTEADLTEALIRQARIRIAFYRNYSNDIDNPTAERTQAVAAAEALESFLHFNEGVLQGLRWNPDHRLH